MAKQKQEFVVHNHPHYRRWSGFVQRTTNSSTKEFKNIGAKNISIDYIWSPENPYGLINFGLWVEERLLEDPTLRNTNFKVGRIDVTKGYGPGNCILTTPAKVCQNRTTSVLNEKLVIQMRRYIKTFPNSTLTDIAAKFEHDCIANISRCIRGISWSSVNEIEPPFVRGTDYQSLGYLPELFNEKE